MIVHKELVEKIWQSFINVITITSLQKSEIIRTIFRTILDNLTTLYKNRRILRFLSRSIGDEIYYYTRRIPGNGYIGYTIWINKRYST